MSLSTYKTFSPSETVPYSKLKLCKDCKYYVIPLPPQEKNKKLGKCSLFGTVNLIDGEVEYKFVSDVRPALCNGKYYEEVKNTEL